MAGHLWTARFEMALAGDFSLENEIVWPAGLTAQPRHSLYESPDDRILVCELFFEAAPEQEDLGKIEETLRAFFGDADLSLTIRKIKNEDWVQKSLKRLKPLTVGRFFVHGRHHAGKIPAGKIPLRVEASLAFGTGHHETTRGCLLALQDLPKDKSPKTVLDLGTGSGILAIAAKHLWPGAAVTASDFDPEALEKAAENISINQAEDIALVEAGGFADAFFAGRTFDLIIANILAGPLIDLAGDIREHSAPGGVVILSGILEEQKAGVLEAYKARGFSLSAEREENGWPALTLRA